MQVGGRKHPHLQSTWNWMSKMFERLEHQRRDADAETQRQRYIELRPQLVWS